MVQRTWDYRLEYEDERQDILDAVDGVFRSGQLILGESVKSFEQEFADYHGVRSAVSCDNGTNAIVLGLRALGIKAGDEVITVSNTAAPTVIAIDQIGAVPVFVDIHPESYLMNTDQVRSAITDRTRCMVPVHLYGQCVDMAPLEALAAERGITILEDCAQAHGARHHGRIAGAMSRAAAFSFYPTKVLGAYGDGGTTITSDEGVEANLRRLRYYGMEKQYYVTSTPGHNSRLDEVQAEILRRKLRRLDEYIANRRRVAHRYANGLSDTDLVLPEVSPGNEHVYYLYVVRHARRDQIIERLKAFDIALNVSYQWPVHTMTGFRHLGYRNGSLPVTEKLADEIFSLPMYASLSNGLQDKVISAIRQVLQTL